MGNCGRSPSFINERVSLHRHVPWGRQEPESLINGTKKICCRGAAQEMCWRGITKRFSSSGGLRVICHLSAMVLWKLKKKKEKRKEEKPTDENHLACKEGKKHSRSFYSWGLDVGPGTTYGLMGTLTHCQSGAGEVNRGYLQHQLTISSTAARAAHISSPSSFTPSGSTLATVQSGSQVFWGWGEVAKTSHSYPHIR